MAKKTVQIATKTDLDNLKEDVDEKVTNIEEPEFTEATTRENIANGENLVTILGKIKKFFTDLKTHAFNTPANNLTTTSEGYALDARQGKTLKDRKSTRLNSSHAELSRMPSSA